MSASSPLFDGAGLQALFADLDAELRTIDKLPVIELAVVGGAAMALQWDLRSTRDVDFVSEGVPQDLRNAAGRVAERHDLPADWLNDGAKGFTPDLAYDGTVVYRGKALTVSVPAGRYLLAMKLFSARETDLDDAVFLGHQYGGHHGRRASRACNRGLRHETSRCPGAVLCHRSRYPNSRRDQPATPHLAPAAPRGRTWARAVTAPTHSAQDSTDR